MTKSPNQGGKVWKWCFVGTFAYNNIQRDFLLSPAWISVRCLVGHRAPVVVHHMGPVCIAIRFWFNTSPPSHRGVTFAVNVHRVDKNLGHLGTNKTKNKLLEWLGAFGNNKVPKRRQELKAQTHAHEFKDQGMVLPKSGNTLESYIYIYLLYIVKHVDE